MNTEIKNLRQRAEQLLNEKNWDALIKLSDEFIALAEQKPNQKASAYLWSGIAYTNKGNNDQALANLNKAISFDSKTAYMYYMRGTIYLGKNNYDQALSDLDKAIELDHQDANSYFGRGTTYIQKENYEKALTDFDKAIKLNSESADIYYGRGTAYLKKENYDKALADFNKAIVLNPERADMYRARGITYTKKGHDEQAIVDFDEAIKLNPNDAVTYGWRGIAYGNRKNYDRAIINFDKAIKLDPQNEISYGFRGLAYGYKENYKKAIIDFDKAIQLNPKNASTYYGRGTTYGSKGNYGKAIEDFVSADQLNPTLKSQYPVIYIASRLDAIFDIDKTNRNKAAQCYDALLTAIIAIQAKLFYTPQEAAVAHYTSLHTLKNLAQKGRFRLYNVAYMNDPEEGRVFFQIMEDYNMPEIEKIFYGKNENQSHQSPAYIGSFIRLDEREQKDNLLLWRTYGKHDSEEAAGSCLIFKRENFANVHQPKIGAMQQPDDTLSMDRTGKNKNAQTSQDIKLPPYKIVYKDTKDYSDLSQELDTLAKFLGNIKRYIDQVGDEEKPKLKKLVRELLDGIRFLFKMSDYGEEKEVRVISTRYYKENTTQESDGIKVDTEHIPPRFYLETPESFRFSEVILGPKTRNTKEWERWIKEQNKDVKVEQSEIKYGTPY